MAFHKLNYQDRENLPAGAIEIRREKVSEFYSVVAETHENQSEVWALNYGPAILGMGGALSGWYGNMYFRRVLRLKEYGFFSTYLPNMALPFLIVQSLHGTFIQPDIYTDPLGCSICKGTRAAGIQVALGLVQPLILVPASAFMFATRHFTHRIPSPIHNRSDFFKFVWKLYRPLKVPMTINVGFQILLAFFITHMEENQFFSLQRSIMKPDVDAKIDA